MDWQKYASTINTLVATAAIVFGGIWAVVQYKQEALAERERAAHDSARPFLERQLDLCIEASNAAATLASGRDTDRVAAAIDRFWELYLGSLHIVEDTGPDSVAARMIDFGETVKELPSDPKLLAEMETENRGLSGGSLSIAKACRRLIEKSWQSVVPQLREQ